MLDCALCYHYQNTKWMCSFLQYSSRELENIWQGALKLFCTLCLCFLSSSSFRIWSCSFLSLSPMLVLSLVTRCFNSWTWMEGGMQKRSTNRCCWYDVMLCVQYVCSQWMNLSGVFFLLVNCLSAVTGENINHSYGVTGLAWESVFSYWKEKLDLMWTVKMHFYVRFKVGLIFSALLCVQQINFENTRRKLTLSSLVNLSSMTRPSNVLPLGQIWSLQFCFSSPDGLSVIIFSPLSFYSFRIVTLTKW